MIRRIVALLRPPPVNRMMLLALLSISTLECRAPDSRVITDSLFNGQNGASTANVQEPAIESSAQLAASDPFAFFKHCRDHYDRTVTDYRCIFLKREFMNGRLGEEQEMAVLFREKPFSVDMRWIRNPGGAQHVNYVAGRWNEDGKEMVHILPSGVLALLAPNGVKRPILAPEVRTASRRSIDQFGFRNTLDLITYYTEMAKDHPDYHLRHLGVEVFDDRSCYVFERRLPHSKLDDPYPDRILMIYIDQEWLVPLACLAYADDARTELLGSYVTRSIEFNVGLTDADFDPENRPSGVTMSNTGSRGQ